MYQVTLDQDELFCCGKDTSNQISHIVAYLLLTLSCSGNCFIYLATSKRFRAVAYQHYQLLFTPCYPNSTTTISNRPLGNHTRHTSENKRKVTPITPFGTGYVSWGTGGSDDIEVVVSQRTAHKDCQVMKVSVISNVSNY